MARTIGEGFVRVRPDTSTFGPEAERGLRPALVRVLNRLESILARLEPIAARVGAEAGRRFADGAERETSRLQPILNGLFRVSGAAVLGGGMAYVAAQALALASAVSTAAGAVLTLPGAAVTAAAGLGVLAIATRGLGDALAESTGGGGGGARAAAAAYEAAQRRIAAATREAERAARDLIEARKEEAARHRQLALDVEGAALAVERATRAEEEAKAALEKATQARKPDLDAIREADLAYREAQHRLKEARARHEELVAAQEEAARTGVEGSRAVQDALQRQRDAEAELAAAKRETTTATGRSAGAVSKAAQAYAQLAPSAQALVRTIRALKPAWDAAGRSIQQRVWAGVAGDVRGLSARYLPVLTHRLGEVGGAWNTAIRQSARLAMSKGFVRDVDVTLAGAAATSDRLARAVAPIVSALRHIGVVGMQYLPGLAGGALSLAERFERWAAAARGSGQLDRWLSRGLATLRQILAIGGNVASIIVGILRAGGAEAGTGMLAGLGAGTARLKNFLNSAEGQDRISGVLSAIRDVGNTLITALPRLADNAAKLAPALAEAAGEGGDLRDALSVADVVVGFLADHLDLLVKLLPVLAAGFVLSRVAQTGANLAAVVSLPIKAAEVAANWGLRRSMDAHTAALLQNTAATRGAAVAQAAETAATNGGILAKGRAVVATTAHRVAAVAANVATKAWAAGQWLLNAALSANPIGLVIIAVMALIAGIVLLWKNSETFRTVVTAVWKAVWGAIKAVVDWIVNTAWPAVRDAFGRWLGLVRSVYGWVSDWLGRIVSFVKSLPGKITSAARGLFDGIVAAAKGGINKIIDVWNRLDFSMSIRVPDWIPGVGGQNFTIPDLFPDIPRLADGGVVRARRGGILANIAEGGEDEAVAPLSALAAMISQAVRDASRPGIHVEQVVVKAFTDRFSLRQVQEELVMHGVH